ncbi:MAG: hypothetical protein M1477_00785 [Candidatus Thermoplasmatota archaeon]|nr:hypothetical protein [Candidatus Thermoplasmatota archaeon]
MEVDIKPLKREALTFPEPVKSLILSEPDTMESSEFITKVTTWKKIIQMSQRGGR